MNHISDKNKHKIDKNLLYLKVIVFAIPKLFCCSFIICIHREPHDLSITTKTHKKVAQLKFHPENMNKVPLLIQCRLKERKTVKADDSVSLKRKNLKRGIDLLYNSGTIGARLAFVCFKRYNQ